MPAQSIGAAYHTATIAAAWEKAFGYSIASPELARVLRISTNAAWFRLRNAEAHGTVERVEAEGQKPLRFRAVASAVPEHLLQPRPRLNALWELEE